MEDETIKNCVEKRDKKSQIHLKRHLKYKMLGKNYTCCDFDDVAWGDESQEITHKDLEDCLQTDWSESKEWKIGDLSV